ncbi:MAG: hypothetical protein Q7K48_02645 [Fusobacterium sp. JB021]|nr:hypothetical protein [Fusobacterium sp. JB021]MDP0506096.1 hypothetical protein [Fusobacterium sp. JB019]
MISEASEKECTVETTNNGTKEEQFSLLSSSNTIKEEILKKEIEEPIEESIKEESIEENLIGQEEESNEEEATEQEKVIEEKKEDVLEAKMVELNSENEGVFLETAPEIRCSSSKLFKFPLKSGNLPENIKFDNSVVIGHTNVEIGELSIPCYLHSFSNSKLTYLEIKNREFKLGFSVILKDDTIEATNEYFFYEMSKGLNHVRGIEVLKILDKIFSGVPLIFNVKLLFGKLEIENWVELVKIKTALEIFTLARENQFKIQMNKLLDVDNVFYKVNLIALLNKTSKFNTWCNFKIDNDKLSKDKNLNVSDSLKIKRILPFNNKFSIEETIEILEPIGSWELRDNKVVSRKKKCVIALRKLRGGSC